MRQLHEVQSSNSGHINKVFNKNEKIFNQSHQNNNLFHYSNLLQYKLRVSIPIL